VAKNTTSSRVVIPLGGFTLWISSKLLWKATHPSALTASPSSVSPLAALHARVIPILSRQTGHRSHPVSFSIRRFLRRQSRFLIQDFYGRFLEAALRNILRSALSQE
jgi:hypothetical protein